MHRIGKCRRRVFLLDLTNRCFPVEESSGEHRWSGDSRSDVVLRVDARLHAWHADHCRSNAREERPSRIRSQYSKRGHQQKMNRDSLPVSIWFLREFVAELRFVAVLEDGWDRSPMTYDRTKARKKTAINGWIQRGTDLMFETSGGHRGEFSNTFPLVIVRTILRLPSNIVVEIDGVSASKFIFVDLWPEETLTFVQWSMRARRCKSCSQSWTVGENNWWWRSE